MTTRPRVLIAEDDPATLRLLAEILEAEGYLVEEARTGLEASGRVAEEIPDMLLLDRSLPGVSGDEIIRRVRSAPRGARLPIVVLSGIAHPGERARTIDAGADDYLVKPFEPAELIARIHALFRRASAEPILAGLGSAPELDEDLAAASRIVERLQPPPPVLPGFRFSAHIQAARQVGGDFIEYLHRPDGNLTIAAGDVSGKGIASAFSMVMIRALLREFARQGLEFSRILPRLHSFLRRELLPDQLVSLLLFSVARGTRDWSASIAGHPNPLLKRGGEVTIMDIPGRSFLGVEEGRGFDPVTGTMESGDIVLIYSDGLLDAIEKGDARAATARVRGVMMGSPSPDSLIENLRGLLPESLPDDVSIVAIGCDG